MSSGAGQEGAAEALRRLEARLERASEAAESLFAEAAGAAARAVSGGASGGPSEAAHASAPLPPAGWQLPRTDADRGLAGDLEPLVNLLGALRDLIPPELQQRLATAVRELLLALRALIDWYLERLDRRPPPPPEVQDIPIL